MTTGRSGRRWPADPPPCTRAGPRVPPVPTVRDAAGTTMAAETMSAGMIRILKPMRWNVVRNRHEPTLGPEPRHRNRRLPRAALRDIPYGRGAGSSVRIGCMFDRPANGIAALIAVARHRFGRCHHRRAGPVLVRDPDDRSWLWPCWLSAPGGSLDRHQARLFTRWQFRRQSQRSCRCWSERACTRQAFRRMSPRGLWRPLRRPLSGWLSPTACPTNIDQRFCC